MKNIRHDMYFSAPCQCLSSALVRKWHNVPLTFLYQGCCMTVASPLPLLAKKKSVYTSIKHISQGAHTPFYINVQRRRMPFWNLCSKTSSTYSHFLGISSVPNWNTLK